MQTLNHIRVLVDIYDVDADDDFNPLFSITSELEDMRNSSIIETIEITVTDIDRRRREDFDWGRLDEVLSALGWFSLKRVSLSIRMHRCSRDFTKLDVALRKSIKKQFPRLSSSNSVSFDFKVDIVDE